MNSRITLGLSVAFFASLLLYGLYVTLVYFGIPVHGAVLLPDALNAAIADQCGQTAYLCRGIQALLPAALYTLTSLSPFYGYIIVSILGLAGIAFWKAFQDGSFLADWHVKPWHIALSTLGLLWVMFTVLSMGTDGSLGTDVNGADVPRPVRLLFEPNSAVYAVGEHVLQELRSDFTSLQERGCLSPFGMSTRGSPAYLITVPCLQSAFVTRVLSQLAVVVCFAIAWLALGSVLLRKMRIEVVSHVNRCFLALLLGAGTWIAILWLLSVIHLYVAWAGWLLLVASLAVGWRDLRDWWQHFRNEEIVVEQGISNWRVWATWALLSLLILNFLSVVRPFPIGWDDLGSYLNRPRLLVSYGSLIASMSAFQWEYLTSLGFLLFGYSNTFGATASMMVNWLAGALAVLAVYAMGRTILGRGSGVLAALLYYSLPLVGHFSFADMKIDNALLAYTVGGLLALYLGFPAWSGAPTLPDSTHPLRFLQSPRGRLLVLAGVMVGLAFSIKITAAIVLLTMFMVISGVLLSWPGFVGATSLSVLTLWKFGGLRVYEVVTRTTGLAVTRADVNVWVYIICIAVAVVCFGYAYATSPWWRKHLLVSMALLTGVAITTLPWLTYNSFDHGYWFPTFTFRSVDRISHPLPPLGPEGGVLVGELALSMDHPACKSTSKVEELDRYWGHGAGLEHYFGLPWRSVMNLDIAGYYVTTMPALLLLPLLLLLPIFWMTNGKRLRWLFYATASLVMMWIFTGNGVPWYGLPLFAGAVVLLEAMLAYSPDLYSRVLISFLIGLSLLSNVQHRLWKFDELRNTMEYTFGKVSATALEAMTIDWYSQITTRITELRQQLPDRPYVYRIGTFIPYFVPRNLEILRTADNQLDVFTCLYQEQNPEKTLARLKALGFNSIIFDTNTATIEQNPNGTLHQKVGRFQNFINANVNAGQLNLVINDPRAGVAFIEIP